jgi:hypothetical protein
MSFSQTYKLDPISKKSIYESETWHNTLKNNKPVIIKLVVQWRWGYFTILLTNKEKRKILKDKYIDSNNYSLTIDELLDGGDSWAEIKDKESFTNEEIDEIENLINKPKPLDMETNKKMGYNISFKEDILELNGWERQDDTYYEIVGGCQLELVCNV